MAILASSVLFLQAQNTLTWTGGGASDNWSDINNWGGVGIPDATNNILIFNGTTRLTPVNDIVGLTIRQIQFGGSAGNFTISGNSFTLGNAAGSTTTINSTVTGTQTINNDITLGINQTWDNGGTGFFIFAMNGAVNNNGFTLTTDTSGGSAFGFMTINGVISGNGGLVVNTFGSTTLTAVNTYSGLTTVTRPFLNVDGTINGNVTTVGGKVAVTAASGTINGDLAINGFGLQALDLNSALLTVNGNATISSVSSERWYLGALVDDFSGTAGTDWGLLQVNGGDLTYSSGSEFEINFDFGLNNPNSGDPFWNSTRRWLVGELDTGTLTYAGTTLRNGVYTPGYFFLDNIGNDLYLNWQLTPEPSSWAMMGVGIVLASLSLRRRRGSWTK